MSACRRDIDAPSAGRRVHPRAPGADRAVAGDRGAVHALIREGIADGFGRHRSLREGQDLTALIREADAA
jgi:hypothetical protein